MFKLCTLGVVLCLLAPSHETTTGTVVRIKQEALEYVCQEGKPFLLKGLLAIQIPAFKPSRSIFGAILNIVGIKILDVQLPHLSVKLVPKTGVQLYFSSQFHIRGNIMEFKVGSSISLDVRVMRSPMGFPILSITACKSILGDVQILIGGNNLFGFLKPLQNHIRAMLTDKMCLSVSNAVLGLNAELRTMVGLNAISSMSHLQYSMLDNPEITSEYIDLDLNAGFELKGKPVEDSRPVPHFSLPPQEMTADDSMVNMGLSNDMFAHFFQTLEESGAFNLNIGGESGSGNFHLSTSMLQSAIPSLVQKYPRDAAVILNVVLAKFPVVTLKEGRAMLRISPTIQLAVAASASSSETLCTLGCDLSLSLTLAVTSTSVKISVAVQGEMSLAMVSSSVKDIQVEKMRTIIVSVMEKTFLAHMNAVLSGGISLPKLSNVQYTDGDIEIHEKQELTSEKNEIAEKPGQRKYFFMQQGYAQVSCDLDYMP